MTSNAINRRSLIVGAGFATAAPALVRAETMLEIPGDPLTVRGLFAASKWASDAFGELPAARLAFSDGQTTKWAAYNCMSRPSKEVDGERTYAVAIEVVTTDSGGNRFVTSVPVDGVKLARDLATQRVRQMSLLEFQRSKWASWGDLDETPF